MTKQMKHFKRENSSVADRSLRKNTPVLWKQYYNPQNNWQLGYVTEVNENSEWDHELVVAQSPDQKHGNFATEWIVISELPLADPNDDKYGLTKDKKVQLAKDALEAATALGYCDESKKVLERLDFPTSFPKKVKKTVYIEILDNEDADAKLKSLGLEVATAPYNDYDF